ncbi:MAG: twin-arginine translocation signal domain-containing protein [Sphingomonadaceae bacterium]|nr:twin-arginine translocation signal domain-containing protein [Sphingomonadaceae bacterium]
MNKKLDRRSFLRRVGATAGIGALGVITGTSAVRAQVSDSDTGRYADPAGGGTDNDTGANSDRVGSGRGSSDRAGNGRRCSDNDSGGRADPGGRGRSCSDSD